MSPPPPDPLSDLLKDFASNPTEKTEEILKQSLQLLAKTPNEGTVTNITNAFKDVEGIYQRMPESLQKDALADALRDSHKEIAAAIIDLATSSSPVATILEQNPKFADSTLGRVTIATYMQQSETSQLPAKYYSTDMMAPSDIPKYAASKTLYTEGLFKATKPATSPPSLSMTEKFAILARFEADQSVSAPLERDETYAPFIAAQRDALLQNGDTSALAQYPILAKAVKIGLPEKIRDQITPSWISSLQTVADGEKQWETQFEGFETELLDGICKHLEKDPRNLDNSVLLLAMAVAEKCDTAEAYQKVMSRIQDSYISRLIGRDADPELKTIVAKNPQWKSAIGARIDERHTSEQEKLLTAAMLIEVKLPVGAKEWVPKLGRTHIGGIDFKITPKALVGVLKDNPLAATSTNTKECDFCTAVDTFCENPSAKDALHINALYHQATQFGTDKTQPLALRTRIGRIFGTDKTQPLELLTRIELITGIFKNLATLSEQNMTVADLGNRTWPKRIKSPLEDPQTIRPTSKKSSYYTALQAFQTEKGNAATPKTLNDWVRFLKHDSAAKVDKYTEKMNKAETLSQTATKTIYTSMVSDATSFGKTMDNVTKALAESDIPTARTLLQAAIKDLSASSKTCADTTQFTKTSLAAKNKRLNVLEEMIRACRRMDKGIAGMLEADTKAAETPPPATPVTTPPTTPVTTSPTTKKTPLKALTPIPNSEIHEALHPAMRAYAAGIHATTPSEIDKQIATLDTEKAGSIGRVKVAAQKTEKLKNKETELTRKDSELKDLLATIRAIEVGQAGNAAALAALGDPTSTDPGNGLYGQLHEANTNLGIATRNFDTHTRDLEPLTRAVTTLTQERDRLELEVAAKTNRITAFQGADGLGGEKELLLAELQTLRTVRIPGLQAQLQTATEAIDRLDIDLQNVVAITALDAAIATLNQRIDDLGVEPPETLGAAEDANPLLGATRTQANIDDDIAACRQQITALETGVVITANGNATILAEIRGLDEEQLRTDILDQTEARARLATILTAAIQRRDTEIPEEIRLLDVEVASLTHQIGVADARLVELNDTVNVDGSIRHATAASDAKQRDVDAATALVTAQNTTIRGLQDEIVHNNAIIAAHQALVGRQAVLASKYSLTNDESLTDAKVQSERRTNAPLLEAAVADHKKQQEIEREVTTKEDKIQTAITEREANLGIRKTNLGVEATAQRQALERDTVLGRPSGKANETRGDVLAEMITEASAPSDPKHANLAKYKTLQTQLQTDQFGNALATIKSINNNNGLKFLSEAIPSYMEEHSAIRQEVVQQAPSFISKFTPTWPTWSTWSTRSTQKKALIAAGPVKTLEDRIKLAVRYGQLRKDKETTEQTKAAVKSYNDAINGTLSDTPPGSLQPLRTLLMNDTPAGRKAAIHQLDNAIIEIQTRMILDKGTDQTIKVCTKLIAALNDLKSNIDQATRKTATGRSDAVGEIAALRDALVSLSDDPTQATPTALTNGLKQENFFTAPITVTSTPVTPTAAAKSLVPTARAKLERMGLLHNTEAPWSADPLSTEMCTLFLAEIQSTTSGDLFETITDDKDSFLTFRDRLATDTKIPNKSLKALAIRAKIPEKEAIIELDRIFKQLKKTYTELNQSGQGTKLTGLKAHAASISAYLKSLAEDSVPAHNITDPAEQALLCTLGILHETPKAIDDAAAESVGRLYEHRPLTMGLLTDVQAAAPHAASEPNVIRCMRTAFSQATGLYGTKESDKELMKALCENSEAWSLALLKQPWDQDQSPKAAVTNADRLTHTRSAYTQACALRDRLSEVDKQKQDDLNLQNISDTLDHLLLDIQRGIAHTNTEGKAAVLALSLHDTPEKQLAAVGEIRIGKQSQSAASTPPVRSHVKPKPAPVFTNESKAPTIKRLPRSGLITNLEIDGTKHSYLPYVSDAPENSPENALKALFGKPVKETFDDETWLRCEIETSKLDSDVSSLRTKTVSTEAENFLRQALLDIAKETGNQAPGSIKDDNASLKSFLELTTTNINATDLAWLNNTDTPLTTSIPTSLETAFRDKILKDIATSTRPLSPNELLFIAALKEESIVILEPQDDGTYTATQSLPGKTPLVIEYVHGQYQRLESVGSKVTATKIYTPTPVNVAALGRSWAAPNVPTLGATFGDTPGDTTITCWLEAAIYSAAYDPSGSLITKMTEALSKTHPAPLISAEKRAFLTRYLQFLTDANAGGHVRGIAALNQEVQALYFEEAAIRQQDPMDFLRPLHADLDRLLGNTDGSYTRKEILKVQTTEKWTDGTPDNETYNLYDRKVKLIGQARDMKGASEDVAKRVPIAIMLGNLVAGDLARHLTSESGSDSLRGTEDGSLPTDAIIGKTISYEATSLDQLPSECHITVSRPGAWNPRTKRFELGKAPLLTPAIDGYTRYINLPATIDGSLKNVCYTISQIIAHSGGSTESGHYVCYFQPDPTSKPDEWYKKSSNGNAATKLPGGYADVESELGVGNLTYTYMGVKA